MIFGMTPLLFAHVVVSLLGIASGFVVLWGLLTSRRLNGWTAFFLITTIATSASGFFLPAKELLPSHIVGILSLVVLAIALVARYPQQMRGVWRAVYVVTAIVAQYLNFAVLIVQSFLHVPTLHELAPT